MKLTFKNIFAIAAFSLIGIFGHFAFAAGGKGMDCNECRESYPDLKACTPICGGQKFKGDKSKKFYELLKTLGAESCGEQGCSAELTGTHCTWQNSKQRKNFECTYTLSNGKSGSVQGSQAGILTKEIERMGKISTSCGAGTCGFEFDQDISCNPDTEKGNKTKKIFVCRVSQIVAKPSANEEPDGAPAKDTAEKKDGQK